jgi:putative transposase
LDVGLNHFYTDSEGNTVENPRYLRKAEKALKRGGGSPDRVLCPANRLHNVEYLKRKRVPKTKRKLSIGLAGNI